MKQETTDRLINALGQMFRHNHELWLKVISLERAIKKNPEIRAEYLRILKKAKIDPTLRANALETSKILEELRKALLQDHV